MEKFMCECCGLNPAEIKDYRGNEATGNLDKFYVCRNCFNLNNYWFYRLMRAKDKKRIIRQILVGGDWREWLISGDHEAEGRA